MSGDTAIHRLVRECRAGRHAACVRAMRSGWVILGERQVLRGYCLLLPDPVVPHLNALSGAARALFLEDMALIGDALLAVTGAVRINYAMFGNLEPALHAHVFPRFADEAPSLRSAQPWALDWAAAPSYDAVLHDELRRRIGAALPPAP
jgi:diadenosine tetraphosphate (Ap4A) HIT family hydrolase